jgi:hypothetical protein
MLILLVLAVSTLLDKYSRVEDTTRQVVDTNVEYSILLVLASYTNVDTASSGYDASSG